MTICKVLMIIESVQIKYINFQSNSKSYSLYDDTCIVSLHSYYSSNEQK